MRLLHTGFAAALLAMPAFAQDTASYPAKPVTLVVPFAAGGPTDTLARVLAQKLTDYMGRPFIIDNRPGAGGNTGSAQVARAAPNGYLLVLGTVATHGINPSLYRNMPYDHRRDFAPVSQISIVPNVLVVHPSLPVKSVPGLVTFLNQNPGNDF
jgi:tripartite-type tricarboxylate transporter receptor subunit TctC